MPTRQTNGATWAVVALGDMWQLTRDLAVKRLFDSGIESITYYTPTYDTGSWTLYSRRQG